MVTPRGSGLSDFVQVSAPEIQANDRNGIIVDLPYKVYRFVYKHQRKIIIMSKKYIFMNPLFLARHESNENAKIGKMV